MVAFAPVMYVGHQSSPLITFCIWTGLDKIITDSFVEVLWIKDGYDRIDTFIYDWAPTILTFVPRTTWAFVEAIVGVDAVSHMSSTRMPMMARNDVGGASSVDLKHWMLNARSGKFQTKTGEDYDVQALKQNLANTEILLLAGAHDAFSQPADVDLLQALLPEGKVTRVNYEDYNHLDYMWADDVKDKVNNKVL